MRALLAVAILAVTAPTAANACAMRMRVVEAEPVNLAALMDEVDEEVAKPEAKPEAVKPEAQEAPSTESAEPAPKPNS